MSLVPKWWLSSIQHAIDLQNEKERKSDKKQTEDEDESKEDASNKWINLYEKGEVETAEKHLVEQIAKAPERYKSARMYNDLGYIRSGQPGERMKLAYKDLETALDLHSSHVQLTVLNLGYLDIKNEQYEKAIGRIETALFLSLSPIEIQAAYLRLLLAESKIGFKNNWEQHPANVIEASYINLAYALLKFKKHDEARDTLKEGLEIMPSSVRIKHALARFYLYNKDAQPSYLVYNELAEESSRLDEALKREVRYFENVSKRGRGKSAGKNRK